MKKAVLSLIISIILVSIGTIKVYAANLEATIDIQQDKTEAKAGDTVQFTLKLVNISNAENDVVAAIAR